MIMRILIHRSKGEPKSHGRGTWGTVYIAKGSCGHKVKSRNEVRTKISSEVG